MNRPEEMRGAGLVERGLTISGKVVTRPAGRWTPSVHHLLTWLRANGCDFVPRPIGRTAQSEQLEFLPGRDQGWPLLDDIQSPRGAFECGALARRLTDALSPYPCPPDAVWQSVEGPPAAGMQIQHGDLGPWNLLWSPSGPQVCGVIDWDQAEPGYPTYDIGFLAWFIVPVIDDERAHQRGFSAPPVRIQRLRAFAQGLDWDPGDLLTEVTRAQRGFIHRVVTRGTTRDTDSVWNLLYRRGFHERAKADLEYGLALG